MKSKELDTLAFFDYPKETIPRLDILCESFADKGLLNIEIKHTNGRNKELSLAVLQIIEKQKIHDRVWISSFNPYILSVIQSKNKSIKTALLFDKMKYFPVIFADFIKCEAWHPNFKLVDEEFIVQAKKRNKEVYVWTINNQNDIQKMQELSVTGIISDNIQLISA